MSKKILVSSFLASAMFFLAAIPAYASTSLSGYAWSSNIGWISFNSADGATIQLATTTTTGTFSGYAWSSNIGWIQFGGLAGSTVGGQTTSDATVDLSTGQVSGWARAVSAVGRTDGWDGWIELSGANHLSPDQSGNGGVTLDTSNGAFKGYAWGSDVVGWVSWAGVFANGLCPVGGCPIQPTNTLTGSCHVSTTTDQDGSSVDATFTINVTNGTGVINYSWDGGNTYLTSNSSTTVFASSGTGPIVPVQDSATPPNTGSVDCSGIAITVSVSPNPIGGVPVPTVSCPNYLTQNTTVDSDAPFYIPYTWVASGSGGPPVGSFTYLWSDDDSNYQQNTEQFNGISNLGQTSVPITMYVEADKGGSVSTSTSCGTVNVMGTPGNGHGAVVNPIIWIHTPTANDTSCIGNYPSSCSFHAHAHPGNSVTVGYDWPGSLSSCTSTMQTTSGYVIPNWNGTSLLLDETKGYGLTQLSGLQLGVYTLGYQCTNTLTGVGGINASNTVEIDVTPSTYGEK